MDGDGWVGGRVQGGEEWVVEWGRGEGAWNYEDGRLNGGHFGGM